MTDFIPVPSRGLLYDNLGEYLEVHHLTTEDELMMTSPNLFHKGDALYRLLEKNVCKLNDIKLNDILINDKESILLWIREMAYGNIIENEEIKKIDGEVKKETFYFDTHTLNVSQITIPPDDGKFYTYNFNSNIFKLKLLTIGDEKKFHKLMSKLDWYCAHIHSINGNEDWSYIRSFVGGQCISNGKKIKSRIDKLNFGVNKITNCIINGKSVKTNVDINELFFGYTQDNLGKINKGIRTAIFFLINEGNGYTDGDIKKMATFDRKFHEELLMEKINKINEQNKTKK